MIQPPMPHRFAELRDRIDDVSRRARALLECAKGSSNTPDLARTRWQLTKALSDYHAFILGEFCSPGSARAPAEANMISRIKSDCDALNKHMQEYARKWSTGDNSARWEEYRPAALALLASVQEGLARNDVAVRDLILARAAREPRQAS